MLFQEEMQNMITKYRNRTESNDQRHVRIAVQAKGNNYVTYILAR